jgi:hypothetical protein
MSHWGGGAFHEGRRPGFGSSDQGSNQCFPRIGFMARILLLVGTLGRMFDLHVHIGIPNGYSDQDAAHARSLLLVRNGIGLAPPPAEIVLPPMML